MYHFFYTVPNSAVSTEIDGFDYVRVPVGFCAKSIEFVSCAPRMLRVTECAASESGLRVFIGRMGDKIAPLHGLPDGVSVEYRPDPVVIR